MLFRSIQPIETIEAQFLATMNQVGIDAIKIGMLFSSDIIKTVAKLLKQSNVKKIVVDPVMIGKLKSKLLQDEAIEQLKESILPQATVITPNMEEASLLLDGRKIQTLDDIKEAAIDIHKQGYQVVLVKGGRLEGPATDVLFNGDKLITYKAPRIDTNNTSGAGCTYSAAITANLAKGMPIYEAVHSAKSFITTAIEYGFSYSNSNVAGPTDHAAYRKYNDAYKIAVQEISYK